MYGVVRVSHVFPDLLGGQLGVEGGVGLGKADLIHLPGVYVW